MTNNTYDLFFFQFYDTRLINFFIFLRQIKVALLN